MYFSEEYFKNTVDKLPVVQFVTFKDNEPIASSLCLLHGHYLHPHFLAYKADYSFLRPVNILVDEMIKYGIEIGAKIFHFGGGRTTNKEDSLLRFKKNYSDLRGSFYIGKKIHNENIYSEICHQWSEKNPNMVNKYNGMFLKYRNLLADSESIKNVIADQVL
jgi:lipid II:glycine glycyltransferase (peptidoglycan interpeptide bridge formation enzyme)